MIKIGILLCFLVGPLAHADTASYQEAERLFLQKNYAGATEKLNQILNNGDQSPDKRSLAKAHNLKGLVYFQLKNSQASTEEFAKALEIAGNYLPTTDSLVQLTKYNLANALYSTSQMLAGLEIIQTIEPSALDADTRLRFYHLLGNIDVANEKYVEGIRAYAVAANSAKDSASAANFLQKILNSSKKIFLQHPQEDLLAISRYFAELPPLQVGTLALQVLVARGELYAGRSEEAERNLKEFLEKSPETHLFRAKAREILDQLQKLTVTEPSSIGLLLPLSGKFAQFGRTSMNAALMALKVFEDMPDGDLTSKISFVVRDSGDTAESAVEALEKLATEDHVVAVIGPLLSKQAEAVAQKSQEYGMPLLSLSQKKDLDKIGGFIFPIALSPLQQIDTALEYAFETKHYKRFIIMAPSDNFGNEYVKTFWDAVEARGGEIVDVERYAPKTTDFRDEIHRLLGLEYTDARNLEYEELKRREAAFAAGLKAKGPLRKRLLRKFQNLKPVVDFDAIFIPDDPSTVGQIVPAFAVEDVENIPFIGINTWNNPEIVQRAGRYLQQSLFVDGFFPYSKTPEVADFVDKFSKNLQSTPGTLEAQAYDAAQILIQVLTGTDIDSRSKLRDKIVNQSSFDGISGSFKFTEQGTERSAYLLSIKGNNIVEIVDSPADED
jgi:branched-chain amino acid transport system substrate-binding protein